MRSTSGEAVADRSAGPQAVSEEAGRPKKRLQPRQCVRALSCCGMRMICCISSQFLSMCAEA